MSVEHQIQKVMTRHWQRSKQIHFKLNNIGGLTFAPVGGSYVTTLSRFFFLRVDAAWSSLLYINFGQFVKFLTPSHQVKLTDLA